MHQYFRSSGHLPGDLLQTRTGEQLDFSRLPGFLRVLLTTDGTVTKGLEAYFWEPVGVENLGQGYITLEQTEPSLQKHPGDRLLERRVQLIGEQTGRCYASAFSLVDTSQLSTDLRQGLEAGQLGIGELLRDSGLETYREIVDFGRLSGGEQLFEEALGLSSHECIWRCYRIVQCGRPVMQIREFFPLALYHAAVPTT